MPTVTNTPKITVLFYGKNPYFLNVAMDLEELGCKAGLFPILYSDEPKIGAFDVANAQTGDNVEMFDVKPVPKDDTQESGIHVALPKEIRSPAEAIQYARALLARDGYTVEEDSKSGF